MAVTHWHEDSNLSRLRTVATIAIVGAIVRAVHYGCAVCSVEYLHVFPLVLSRHDIRNLCINILLERQ